MVSLEQQISFNDAKSDIPVEFVQSVMHSNDLDVLKKVQKEIIPRELSSFGYQTASGVVSSDTLSNKLTFYASDPRMYIDLLNSYFTAEFRAVAARSNDAKLAAFMDVGGIHSCIKTLTIKIGGTILMRLDDYNKWYNINNLTTHSAEYTSYMLGSSLDSQHDYQISEDEWEDVTSAANLATATLSNAGVLGAFYAASDANTLADANGIRQSVKVGDIVRINGGTTPQIAYVRAIGTFADAASGIITLANASLANTFTALTATNLLKMEVKRRSSRAYAVNQSSNIKVQWRLPVGCLSFFKYFPLPYIQSIGPLEIEFEFVDPRLSICLRDSAEAAATNKIGYLISKPRFVAMMVEPSNKVRDIHDQLFNGNGLWFPYVNYRHYQNRISASSTDETFTFQTNLSSARHVFSVITSQANDDAATTATQAVKSQSTFYRSQLNYFRFQSGSLQFPDYGNCVTSDIWASDAWAQLMLAFNIKDNTVHRSRIRPFDWQSTTSEKFIIATPLAKDDSMWTGVSLKNNFLELSLNKAAVATAYNAHSYIGYDCALVISKQSGCNVFD